jgi:hypothetical protein
MTYDPDTVRAILRFLYDEETRRIARYEETHESRHETAADTAGELASLVHAKFLSLPEKSPTSP